MCLYPNPHRPRYWWWASAAQLLTLVLVAAEVFGRALPVQHQALLLQAMLLVVAFISTACSPLRSRQLVALEFASYCVLGLTITLGLYFAGDEALSALPRVSACAVHAHMQGSGCMARVFGRHAAGAANCSTQGPDK